MSKASAKSLFKPARERAGTATSTWDGFVEQDTRSGLNRERILSVAISIADKQGLGAVSIRNVAAELESSAMALYHYVPAKRDLLNLMLDATYLEFEWPAEKMDDWREALSHFAWESRRCLKRHPWVSALRMSEPEYGPECIRMLEALLTSLARFGLDVRNAIRVLGILFVFVNGFVAAENTNGGARRASGRGQSPGQHPTFSRPVLATGQFPRVSQFIETGAELPDDAMFGRALQWMVNGMASDIECCIQVAGQISAKQLQSKSKKRKRSSAGQL